MSKPYVYVVDDNAEFRQSVAWMLSVDNYSVQEFGDAESVLEGLKLFRPNCLLLDIRMPGLSGLDLHDRIKLQTPNMPVIYMTGHADVPLAVEAMKKGAVTLLEKPLDMNALRQALQLAMDVSQQQTADAQEADVASLKQTRSEEQLSASRAFEARLATLTPREVDVLECLVEGHANKVCAIELGISIRTVELHRSRLLKKLGVRTGAELIRSVLLHRVGA